MQVTVQVYPEDPLLVILHTRPPSVAHAVCVACPTITTKLLAKGDASGYVFMVDGKKAKCNQYLHDGAYVLVLAPSYESDLAIRLLNYYRNT